MTARHAALDAAVLAAYGFDAKKDLLAQLLALNLEVAGKLSPTKRHRVVSGANQANQPVTAPGIPPGYPDAAKLVTADCIQPSEKP